MLITLTLHPQHIILYRLLMLILMIVQVTEPMSLASSEQMGPW